MNSSARNAPRNRRLRGFEALETRLALDGSGVPVGADAYLTLSFAPDGASIAGQPNELAATFDGLAASAEWQDAILRAFQTWTVHTNADIGLVGDSGAPFGVPGSTRDDARFGDIRIGGAPMAPEIGAISVPIDNPLAGTWHADVIFNTAFPYASLDDLFAIALHEAGNVLGLKDNDDPNSPLKAGPIPTATTPTPGDIAALRALHGARAPDINELDDGNEPEPNGSRAAATEWEADADDAPPGSIPAVAVGDIRSSSDVDYFELELPKGYSGPITVTLRSEGVSLLSPSLRVESSTGATLGQLVGSGGRGDRLSLTVPTPGSGSTLFVRVEGAPGAGLFGVGGYSLVAVFDGANTASPEVIESATLAATRGVEIDDLQQLFRPGGASFRDDLGANDDPAQATPLVAAAGFAAASRYETVASIGVLGDVDYYRVSPPEGDATVAYISLRSLDAGRLVPAIGVVDGQGSAVPARVLVNGAGEVLVEVEAGQLAGELLVRVAAADRAGPFTRGNYALSIGFAPSVATLFEFASGKLVAPDSVAEHTLYAAEPQLFHFILEAGGAAVGPAAVVVELTDASGGVVTTIASPLGESRSAGAVFLPIGQYTASFSVVALGDAVVGPLAYSLRGAPFSDPFAGDGSDPTTNPFDCGDGFFCYPGGIVSSDPFLWDDFVESLTETPTPGDTPDDIRRLLGDWWSWVWTQFGGDGPPLARSDDYTPGAPIGPGPATPNVLDNDVEPNGDPAVALLASGPAHGSVTLYPDGTFVYTPDPGFAGFDFFRYTAFDFVNQSNVASVWVSTSGSNALPGDYNGNGVVDGLDGAFWRSNFGETGGPADGNRDGVVDAADYTVWRDRGDLPAVASAATQAPAPPATDPSLGLIDIPPAGGATLAHPAAGRSADRPRLPSVTGGAWGGQRRPAQTPGPAANPRDEAFASWSPTTRGRFRAAIVDAPSSDRSAPPESETQRQPPQGLAAGKWLRG